MFVVFDLEFTTWPDAPASSWSGPGQLREIVQIGALRLDDSFTVVEEFQTLVRPVANPELSAYFVDLTGISQADVDRDGLTPTEAISEFLGFCQAGTVLSYGNDMVVLGENIGWARARGEVIGNRSSRTSFINVRPWINALAPQTTAVNSGRLWQVLGVRAPADGNEHSALFDCHSLTAALAWLAERGHRLPDAYLNPPTA